jgi:hypothetical protein
MRYVLRRAIRLCEERASALTTGLVVLAFAVGLAYAAHLGEQLPYIDEQDYLAIAHNVATRLFFSGDGERPNAARAPVYPLLLAGLVRLGSPLWAMRLLNFSALALAVWLLAAVARHETTRFGGVLAAALVFAYPVLFYTAGRFFPQTLAGFLLVLLVFLLARAPSVRGFVVTGLVFGLLVLTVPLFIIHLAVVGGWLVLVHGRPGLRAAVTVIACAALLVSAWSVRNYLAFGSFVLLTTSSGAGLLWGNSPHATIGSAQVDFLVRYYAETHALNEVERSAYFTAEALKYIRTHKLEALGFYFLKVVNHFNFYNEHVAASEASPLRVLVMLLTYGPLLALLVVRLAQWRRFPPGSLEGLMVVLYISAAFVYAIFHTRIRYRIPFDYLLLVLVGMHGDRLVRAWLAREGATGVLNQGSA